MRAWIVALSFVVGTTALIAGQSTTNAKLQAQLKQLFPTATEFSPKQSNPPHFKAYSTNGSGQTLLGLAFWTTELDPLERGYDGPIAILVGMTMKGVLTGVVVGLNHEPYGYFSVDKKEFADQFAGKDIRDPFKVGSDVDAVSRATLSIGSATRSIRNSARRVARQLLPPP